jgi:LysW-gamma-L-lysine carboxypeptidase
MIVAASQLTEEGYRGGFIVAGVVDEEGKGRGVKNIIEEGTAGDVDYAVFGEPTNVDTLTTGYKGSLLLDVTCTTETGHSSAPWLFDNSVERGFEVWNLLKGLRMPQERPESRFHSISYCLQAINGGGEGSTVPSRCDMRIGIRIPPAITVDKLLDEILCLIDGYRYRNPSVEVSAEMRDSTEAYASDTRSPLVRSLSQAIWEIKGKRVRLVNRTGTGDMNNFGNSTGIPSVTYGPGDPHLDHTNKEHIIIGEYLESIKILKKGFKNLSKHFHPS